MRTVKLNNYNLDMFIVYDDIKLENISLIDDFSIQSTYNLITMDNRDGYILDDRNSLKELNKKVVFYTDSLEKLRDVFVLNKMSNIYLNSNTFFYKGFVQSIAYKPFAFNIYEIIINLILQPYLLKNREIITLTGNGTIDNIGDFRNYPIMEIVPTGKEFSININNKPMKFKESGGLRSRYIVDLENIEIYGNSISQANIRNSVFQDDSDFLYLEKGLNTIVLSNISEVKFKINWRYMYHDLFKNR